MVRKLACAAVLVVCSVGLVMAEDFGLRITKIEGDKITGIKGAKKDVKGTEVTLTVAKDVKVAKGTFKKDGDKFKVEVGDDIEGGLKSDAFSKIGKKGINARVTTNDSGTITQIVILGGKKKKDSK